MQVYILVWETPDADVEVYTDEAQAWEEYNKKIQNILKEEDIELEPDEKLQDCYDWYLSETENPVIVRLFETTVKEKDE